MVLFLMLADAMKPDELPTNISWTRRLLTTPLWYVFAIVLPALMPIVIPLLAIYDLVTRNNLSASRTYVFFTYFFVVEAIGLAVALWLWVRHKAGMDDDDFKMANRKLQRWWARGMFWGSLRIFSAEVDIEGLECLEDETPAVVMSRHASTLDTMLPIAVVRQLKCYRYVIKSELLTDPTLDYCAQRFPNVFVDRGSDDPEFEIEKVLALGNDLGDNEAVVMYPEGTRFSEAKRERLLEKFQDDEEMLRISTELENTLPPLREGGVKLLESTPDADVVFIAHRGVDDAAAMSDLITGGLTKAHVEIKMWRVPAASVPRTKEDVRKFFVDHWKKIDKFVGETKAEKTSPAPQTVRVE